MKNTPPGTLPAEVEDAIATITSSISAGDAIIFCGAGISRDSGFPIVDEFVPYVLLTLSADSKEISNIEASLRTIEDANKHPERLKKIIAEKMDVSEDIINNIIYSLPFEAFIETLRDNCSIDKILEVYDAETYQPCIAPNTNHIMIARLFATGKVKTVVTTNFDQLIEKALDHQDKKAGVDYDVLYREEDFKSVDWGQDRCRLIKIHGSIDDKQTIAITLSQVASQETTTAKANIIRHVFSQGNHIMVLVLGYSCSDVFDLSPQIEAIKENLKQVYLVQHSSEAKVQDIRQQEQKNPFKTFDNSTRLFINTNILVEALWKATQKDTFEDHRTLKTTPDWKTKVQAWLVDSIQTHSEAIKDFISGLIFNNMCEWGVAISRYERALANVRKYANDKSEALALSNLGCAYLKLNENSKAFEHYKQAMEISCRIGDANGEGIALNGMGSAYLQRGEYDKAIELYEQALEIDTRIRNVKNMRDDLGNMGIAYVQLGEYGKAIVLYERLLELDQRMGDIKSVSKNLNNMGSAYLIVKEYDKAIEHYKQALQISLRIGYVKGEATALANMGLTYSKMGNSNKTIELCKQALEIFRRIGDVKGECNILDDMGRAYALLGEGSKAIELYERLLEISQRTEDVKSEGLALIGMGSTYALMGNKERASQYFGCSKAIFSKLGLPHIVRSIDTLMKQAGL
jgi:tetratricopeptide (TPR) repeat protein